MKIFAILIIATIATCAVEAAVSRAKRQSIPFSNEETDDAIYNDQISYVPVEADVYRAKREEALPSFIEVLNDPELKRGDEIIRSPTPGGYFDREQGVIVDLPQPAEGTANQFSPQWGGR
jgi:hypothetical protein